MRITGINKPGRVEMPEQSSFPQVKGKSKEEAARIIKSINPDLNLVFMRPGQPFTRDLISNRVRIIVGDDGKVVNAPSVG